MTYQTKQKDKIISLIKEQRHAFTIKEIYDKLNHEIGMTTIYRLTDKLTKEGRLNKSIGSDNTTYYEYLELCPCENHFYLKCQKCGLLIHIDCKCIHELTNHILKEHHFKTNNDHIIINGLCNKCKGGASC